MKFPFYLISNPLDVLKLCFYFGEKSGVNFYEDEEMKNYFEENCITKEIIDFYRKCSEISMIENCLSKEEKFLESLNKRKNNLFSDLEMMFDPTILLRDYATSDNVKMIFYLLNRLKLSKSGYYQCMMKSNPTFFFRIFCSSDEYDPDFVDTYAKYPSFLPDVYLKFLEMKIPFFSFHDNKEINNFRDLFKDWYFPIYKNDIVSFQKEFLKLPHPLLLTLLEEIMLSEISDFRGSAGSIKDFAMAMYFLNGGYLMKIKRSFPGVECIRTKDIFEIKTKKAEINEAMKILLHTLDERMTFNEVYILNKFKNENKYLSLIVGIILSKK